MNDAPFVIVEEPLNPAPPASDASIAVDSERRRTSPLPFLSRLMARQFVRATDAPETEGKAEPAVDDLNLSGAGSIKGVKASTELVIDPEARLVRLME